VKFKFRYDSVLAVKEILIDEKDKELRKLNQKIEDKKRLIKNIRDEAVHLLEKNASRKIRSSDLQSLKNYQNFLMRKEKREKEKLQKYLNRREELITKIVELNKEKRIIEKLKAKYFENYLTEENRKEQKAMNDFAVQSFVRRK
jgi:flagellar FliJ protein